MSAELIPVAIVLILVGAAFVLAEMSRWIWVIYAVVDLLWIAYGSLIQAPGTVVYGISMSVLCVYGLWRWDRKRSSADEGAPLERVVTAALRWRDATPAEHAHKYHNPSVELINELNNYEEETT